MAKKKTKKTNKSHVGLGVGLTTAAVAAASTYLLYGGSARAKANRQKVKGWTLRAKGEVLEALEKADGMSREDFEDLINNVSAVYGRLKNASKTDIATFRRDMEGCWGNIEKISKPLRSPRKVAKKTTRKTTKKATRKVAKKRVARKRAS